MPGYEPLVVTAYLATAYSAADPWSPSLDGILAYWAAREQLGEEAFALNATGAAGYTDIALPLGREEQGGWWWWQCSSPVAVNPRERFTRHFHRRFDADEASRRTRGANRVETKGGPYKEFRNPRLMTVAEALRWHVIGEAGEIHRLLRYCAHVGFGHTKGYGQVERWDVAPGGDERLARFLRPLPVAFARLHGISGMELTWGIRPPGRAIEHQTRCVMPAREDLVILGPAREDGRDVDATVRAAGSAAGRGRQ